MASRPFPTAHRPLEFGYEPKEEGFEVIAAVFTAGDLLSLKVTLARAGERETIDILAEQVREVTGKPVQVVSVDQGSRDLN